MIIEIGTTSQQSTTDKGTLLENLAEEFLKSQSFSVTTQVRLTAAEIDLLCQHKVSGKTIYVECKAYRENLSSNFLTKLLGTVTLKNYDEGWLISTGPFGKDAKGFVTEWKSKPASEQGRLSFYTPDLLLEALIGSGLILPEPTQKVSELLQENVTHGEWYLVISKYGKHWILPILVSGLPTSVVVFDAKTNNQVADTVLLTRLSKLDTSIRELDFLYVSRNNNINPDEIETTPVVEVQTGDSWTDYRPSRPKDFVGRLASQNKIINLLKQVREKETDTRIFAIKGDSGLGKSSLIAKIRDRAKNKRYKNSYFVYAVDIRAASAPNYIFNSIISCFKKAQNDGFIDPSFDIQITNYSNPLASKEIQEILNYLIDNNKLICLVFDQFEELYSKPDLFRIFEVAKSLMIETVAQKSNFIIGFAWKSDATIPQDHPAYYLWHSLSDYRFEIELSRFNYSEASSIISLLEKSLNQRLRTDLKQHIIESSQGFPWLLKKLSIHTYNLVSQGMSQEELIDNSLNVTYLFDRDLQDLSNNELKSLKYIATNAPADWYDVLEMFDYEVIRVLQDKRLVVRSGNKLNIYWDIFREYLNSGNVPVIPLTYMPVSPSVTSMLKIGEYLKSGHEYDVEELSAYSKLAQKTTYNVMRDLLMFGVVQKVGSNIILNDSVTENSGKAILSKIRESLRRHEVVRLLFNEYPSQIVTENDMAALLKAANPAGQDRERSRLIKAKRFLDWLVFSGYVQSLKNGLWEVKDFGEIQIPSVGGRRGRISNPDAFFPATSPAKVVDTLEWMRKEGKITYEKAHECGYKSGIRVLRSMGLVEIIDKNYVALNREPYKSAEELLWEKAKTHQGLRRVTSFLKSNPNASGDSIGSFMKEEFSQNWGDATIRRYGNGVRIWAKWVMDGERTGKIPSAPGERFQKNIQEQML